MKVPGSSSLPLQTTNLSRLGAAASIAHLRWVGKPAPPMPRRSAASTVSMTPSGSAQRVAQPGAAAAASQAARSAPTRTRSCSQDLVRAAHRRAPTLARPERPRCRALAAQSGVGPQVEIAVAREERRPLYVERQSRRRQLPLPLINMADPGAALAGPPGLSAALAPARRPKLKMSSSELPIIRLRPWMPPGSRRRRTGLDRGRAVPVDRNPAVLVVQRRIDHERRPQPGRCPHFPARCASDTRFFCRHAGLLRLQPRRVEEHADLPVALHPAPFGAFAEDGGGRHDVARPQLVDETLAPPVDQLRARRARRLRDQRRRPDRAGSATPVG